LPLLEVHQISKSYSGKKALQNASFTVKDGAVTTLLGPNGAGKTTLVKCVLSLVKYDTGLIRIDGVDSLDEHSRKSIAFLPERFSFFPYFTVLSAIKFYADLHGLTKQELSERLPNVLNKLKLTDLLNQKIKTLSKGQLQRVGLSNLLISNAKLYILDEPFSGLDPVGMRELKDLMIEWKKEGKGVLINSHMIAEMEQIADEVIILNKGNILVSGPIEELKKGKSLEELFFEVLKADGAAS
jgi:ABC-type multidrug transport system ATPase subunit